jgi:hypothetical protein
MVTLATNPGQIRVSRLRLLLSEPFWPIALTISTVGLFALSRVSNPVFYTLAAIVSLAVLWLYLVFYLKARQAHFQEGDVNISKVLSLNPPLFATSTNMQTGLDQRVYPVVKIVRGKVPGARGLRWKVGDYFAAACHYSGSLKARHWKDFEPLPLSFATDRVEVLEEHSRRLENLQEDFERRLALVKTPRRPGLYFLNAESLAASSADKRH